MEGVRLQWKYEAKELKGWGQNKIVLNTGDCLFDSPFG